MHVTLKVAGRREERKRAAESGRERRWKTWLSTLLAIIAKAPQREGLSKAHA